jgi:TetR/AcrR family transcriptional regulator
MSSLDEEPPQPTARRSARSAGGERSPEDRLLEAAIALFAERGYEAVSTGQVAKKAELTQSMVHYYFGSKANLWQAAVQHLMRRRGGIFQIHSIQLDLRDVDPASRLKVLIRRFVQANAADPDLTRILVHEAIARTPRLQWLAMRYMRQGYELFNETIQEGIDAGVLRPLDPKEVTNVIVGAGALTINLGTLLAEVYDDPSRESINAEQLSNTLIELIFEGLLTRPG